MGMKYFNLDLARREQLAGCLRQSGFEVEVLYEKGVGAVIRCKSLGDETILQVLPGYTNEPSRFLVAVMVSYRIFGWRRSRAFFARIESALLANSGYIDPD
jgi:hypothetical protein